METKGDKEEFEKTCSIFINTVNNYFSSLTNNASETGVPYLKDKSDLVLRDFTGMIGISGSRKGFVYITGNEGLYKELIQEFIGLEKPTSEDILDMAGELSNVVVGNLRETYGNDFMISVPAVFQGKPYKLKFPESLSVYVIPINWKSYKADVVVSLE